MPENRKYFPHKSVLFCTARTEVGLPLVASHVMNFILWGILARAREMYSVKVCHFIFMANHFHMLLVVDNPEDVSRFIGYVKAESAHAINRLLGRRQRTIWKDGYDSPIVLSAHDVRKCIRYIYCNPAKACLVKAIEDFPGVSSWEMYSTGTHTKSCKRLCRDLIEPLFAPALSINEQKRMVSAFNQLPCPEHIFVLEPDAWIECFPELQRTTVEKLNTRILKGIRTTEAAYATRRLRQKKDVLGSTALRRESMTKEYVPTTFGRKMICLCFDKEYRRSFINTFRALCAEAKEIYQRWRLGETGLRIPPGLFAPPLPALTSALPLAA